MQLLENRVLVKPKKEADKTEGGIIIPDIAKKRSKFGTVVLVGSGITIQSGEEAGQKIPCTVKVGDEVLYESEDGGDIQYEGEPHVLMLETSIMAIL